MKKNLKNALVVLVALALVIAVGKYSADRHLKATDGDENVVTEVTETAENAEEPEEIVLSMTETQEETGVSTQTDTAVAEAVAEAGNEAAIEEIQTEQVERTVRISSNLEGVETVEPGTVATFSAELTGYDGVAYTIQWQKSLDGQTWEDVSGANGLQYSFELTDDTDDYLWRAVVSTED